MAWVALSIFVQIACAIHVIRNGRNGLWIMVIMFFSLLGCAAYFVMEILPGLRGNRHVRTASAKAMTRIDPERDLRAARDRLALADTAANRIAVADALTGIGRHAEALLYYREGLARSPGADPVTEAKLATSLLETGQIAEAATVLDGIPEPQGIGARDRLSLLCARIREQQGRVDDAIAIYEEIVTRYPGEEARCRYAALLIETGRLDRARLVLEEVESRMKRLDRTQRAAESDMYDWAIEQLRRLRQPA